MEDKKGESIGTVTLGIMTDTPRVVEIEDIVRAEFKDHRLVTIAHTEEDAYVLCVENPASTGRDIQQKMYLSEGSTVALFTTYMAYLEQRGINPVELMKQYMQEDTLKYEFNQRKGEEE